VNALEGLVSRCLHPKAFERELRAARIATKPLCRRRNEDEGLAIRYLDDRQSIVSQAFTRNEEVTRTAASLSFAQRDRTWRMVINVAKYTVSPS
jgi:hypothetical protein